MTFQSIENQYGIVERAIGWCFHKDANNSILGDTVQYLKT